MSQVFRVTSTDELDTALAQATGGDTIRLAGGDYGDLLLRGNDATGDYQFDSMVTLVAEDPGNPPVFDSLTLKRVENMTFDGLTVDYTYSPDHILNGRYSDITDSHNIVVRNTTFDGDVAQGLSAHDDGHGFSIGLSVRDSSGITLEDNLLHTYHRGLSVSGSDDVVVSGNEVTNIRMDGMVFAAVQDIVIENNHLHDFNTSKGSLDHSDMIQFWTKGTDRPSADVVIRGNLLDIGEGGATHSIFIRNQVVDQGEAGDEMFYQDFTIENNTIVNGHIHGIQVGETDGLVIRNNTVLHSDGDTPDGQDHGVEIPRISVIENARNVTITDNITSSINGHAGQSDWTVANNVFVQDQDIAADNHYDTVFVTSELSQDDGPAYVLRSDSALAQMNVGSDGVQADQVSDVAINVTALGDARGVVQFDAVTGDLPQGAILRWDMGDGTVMEGASVTHTYEDGGTYRARLDVVLPDGSIDSTHANVGVEDRVILSMRADGSFDATDFGVSVASDVSAPDGPTSTQAAASLTSQAETGRDLGPDTPLLSIDREHVRDILGRDSFEIGMRVSAEDAHSSGEIFRLGTTLIVEIKDNGSLRLRANSEDGSKVDLKTGAGDVARDGSPQDIVVTYVGGQLAVSVNGTLAGSTQMTAPLEDNGTLGLMFGNPWNSNKSFDGHLEAFELALEPSGTGPAVPVDTAPVMMVPSPGPAREYQQPAVQQPLFGEDTNRQDSDDQSGGPVAPPAPPSAVASPVATPPATTPPASEARAPMTQPPSAAGGSQDDVRLVTLQADGNFLVENSSGMSRIRLSDRDNEPGIRMDGDGVAAQLNRKFVDDILGHDSFEIGVALRSDPGADQPSLGDVVRLHGSFVIQTRDDGSVSVRGFSEDGTITRLNSGPSDLHDGALHDITLRYANDRLELWVDGALAAEAEMTSPLADSGSHALSFGTGWSSQNFVGTVEGFSIDKTSDTAAPAPQAAMSLTETATAATDDTPVWDDSWLAQNGQDSAAQNATETDTAFDAEADGFAFVPADQIADNSVTFYGDGLFNS